MNGCPRHRPDPPPPEVAPLPFDGPSTSAGIGRAALRRRLAPLLRVERQDDEADQCELTFRHAQQSCGPLELHGLVLAPCHLCLNAAEHACLVVPLAGDARLRPQQGRAACLIGGTEQGAALMPPGRFQIRCHNWFSAVLIPVPAQRLLNTSLLLAAPEGAGAGELPASRLGRRLASQLERAWQWSGSDPLQMDLLNMLRQTLRLLESSARDGREDFPPPGWRSDALIVQAVGLLLLEANGGRHGSDTTGRHRRLEELLAHIDANLHRPLTLADLSARSGWSSRALQYAFQERFGCGPMHWVRRQRLEAARRALEQAEPGEQVRNIAWRCGYTNLSSFSRDILTTFGSSPSTLLRSGALDRQ
jgi:AraC-like DNA-binding protein